jgi:hypothetical protein
MSQATLIKFIRTGAIEPLALVNESPESREKYLKPFHGRATVACLCADPPIPMTVAHRKVGTESWYLCQASREGKNRHADWCPLHTNAAEDESLEVDEQTPSCTVSDDGVVIHAKSARTWIEQKEGEKGEKSRASGTASARSGAAAPRHARVSLTTQLQILWSQADLNVWKKSFEHKRHYGPVRYWLTAAAGHIAFGEGDSAWTLQDDLFIPPPWNPNSVQSKAESKKFRMGLRARLMEHAVVFLAGTLKTVEEPDKNAGCLTLRLKHFKVGLQVPPELAQQLEKASTPWAGGILGAGEDNSFVLARVRAADIHNVKHEEMPGIICVDLVIQRLSKDWIPVDSENERRIAGALVAEGREFVKPFSEGNKKGWVGGLCKKLGLIPDFVLTDIKPAVFMEVLDRMDKRDYRLRAEVKLEKYRGINNPCWTWDVMDQEECPPFPAAS